MTIQGNLCTVTLINTDYNDKGKWQLLIKTGAKSSLQKHSYEVSVVGRYYKYQNHSIQGLLIYKIKYLLSYTKLKIFSFHCITIGERTTWYDQSEVGKPFFMSHTLNTTISTCNVYDPSAESADNGTSLTSR